MDGRLVTKQSVDLLNVTVGQISSHYKHACAYEMTASRDLGSCEEFIHRKMKSNANFLIFIVFFYVKHVTGKNTQNGK